MSAVRRGFTMVELLVVVAVIAAMLAMLMPALAHAKEAARRAACLSNTRQMGTTASIYASDHRGWLPPFVRQHKGSMHLGYMTANAYDVFNEAADERGKVMTCPSNPSVPVLLGAGGVNEVWSTTIHYMGGWDCRIGSYFQGPGGDFWPGGDLPYFSPTKVGSRGGQIIFADGIYRQPFYDRVSANHGPTGYIALPESHPSQTPIQGGNIGLLDGSASFKPVDEMDCDPYSIPGYFKWFQSNGGGSTVTSLPGQGWNRTHNASYGQWYF